MNYCKHVLIAICLLALVRSSYGQDYSDDIELLKTACDSSIGGQIKNGETVIYIDKLSSWDWLKDKISSQDTFGRFLKQTIILTKKEKESILEQIKTFDQFKWKDSLFNNSTRIDKDSMWPILNRENKKRYTAISNAVTQKDTITINKLKYKLTYIFTFSKPIYIRDKSIALLCFAKMCGGTCGQNEVAFYIKEHDNWIRWVIIMNGDF